MAGGAFGGEVPLAASSITDVSTSAVAIVARWTHTGHGMRPHWAWPRATAAATKASMTIAPAANTRSLTMRLNALSGSGGTRQPRVLAGPAVARSTTLAIAVPPLRWCGLAGPCGVD